MKRMFLIVLLLGHIPDTIARQEHIAFEHFGYGQGLSAPVTNILQDHLGFLWLGTTDGLNRFDGTTFTTYRNIPGDTASLPNNIINNLSLDKKGRIWCATNRGLCYYDFTDDSFHTVQYPNNLEKIDRHRVYDVTEGKNKEIWFATRTIIHVLTPDNTIKSIPLPVDDVNFIIKHLYYGIGDNLWIGSNNGIYVYNIITGVFLHSVIKSNVPGQQQLKVNIHPLVSYNGDTIMSGSWYAGLLKHYLSNDSVKTIYIPDTGETDHRNHIVSSISKTNSQVFWIGTYGNGIGLYNNTTGTFIYRLKHNPADKNSLSSNYVNNIFTDNSGIIWVGTIAGLDKYDPHTGQFSKVSIPEYSGKFSVYRLPTSIVEDKNNSSGDWLWLTVSGYGLIRFNKSTLEFQLFDHDETNKNSIPDNNVRCLFYDHRSRLWIGTKSGICIYNHLKNKFTVPVFPNNVIPFNVNSILTDKKGRYWISTSGNGVYCYDEANSKIVSWSFIDGNPESLPDNYIFSMLEDHEGNIWIGTQNNGLCRLSPETGKFIYFKNNKNDPNSLPDNGVFDLFEDNNHTLWIATENGLGRMNLSDFKIINYHTTEGISNNCVYSISQDKEGFFWFGTGNGLSRYDTQKNTFKNYFINDGLSSNRIDGGVYRSSSGTLFFGTSGMINYCDPSSLKTNNSIPPVVITGIRVFDTKIPVKRIGIELEPVHLNYRQNMLTIEFTALNFTNPFLNQYEYKMEGFDEQWMRAGNKKSATYTNLPGGSYRFVVKAANNDGIWNETGSKVMVTITPPWWKTIWFYVACILVVTAILYSIYKIRIKQLLKLQSIRMRISRDLHDDIGSTLSSINMISNMAIRSESETKNLTEHLKTISSASGEAMDMMNDIVWSVNPENDKMEMILSRMRQYASEILEAARIEFTIEMDTGCIDIKIPIEKRKHFYLIFKESVNNLAKYSGAQKASIRISCRNKIMQLIIMDNGKGFDQENPRQGNGLRNIKTRAEMLKGSIKISSSPEQGTLTDLKFPLFP